jgi:hypothetical protein
MRLAPAAPWFPIAVALAVLLPSSAAAEVRRCAVPGGNVVYTDRSCRSLGAVELPPEAPTQVEANRLYHGRCAATLPDLLYEVTSAIDSHDVNRLAAAYHWPGMSGRAANATLDRLDAIASRQLLDLRVVTADVPVQGAEPDDPYATPEVRVVPTGLRAEQVQADGTTRVSTHFSLRRHLDCWWVRL